MVANTGNLYISSLNFFFFTKFLIVSNTLTHPIAHFFFRCLVPVWVRQRKPKENTCGSKAAHVFRGCINPSSGSDGAEQLHPVLWGNHMLSHKLLHYRWYINTCALRNMCRRKVTFQGRELKMPANINSVQRKVNSNQELKPSLYGVVT